MTKELFIAVYLLLGIAALALLWYGRLWEAMFAETEIVLPALFVLLFAWPIMAFASLFFIDWDRMSIPGWRVPSRTTYEERQEERAALKRQPSEVTPTAPDRER